MKSILLRSNWYNVGSANTNSLQGVAMRIALVYDSQPNSGSTPAWTDIFATASVYSPNNLNNRDRFRIIYDTTAEIGAYTIGTTALTAGNPENVMKKQI